MQRHHTIRFDIGNPKHRPVFPGKFHLGIRALQTLEMAIARWRQIQLTAHMHSKAERLATKSLLARKPKPRTLLDVSCISPKITAEYSNTINGYITALHRTHFP